MKVKILPYEHDEISEYKKKMKRKRKRIPKGILKKIYKNNG
jgi:hypothetical protein